MKRICLGCMVTAVAALSLPSRVRAAQLNVAVFNFQMKSDTPDWRWLEKGLADQITTDFTRSRRISVVARDEMQLLARKLKWVPEMATVSPAAAKRIKQALKIDRLVTGVYSVKDERIEITAQIIDVESRKELARKVLAGPTEDVLKLQKKLSAELLGWFSGVPAEKILPHLPVWTQSIPATKALYEGLHLYDEGRYPEAWLKFRQAWRDDPTYMEAHYWVGRMYYFMDRYEHARRAYERFVYMDATHPRTGDAIKEYLHTYEKLNFPPEAMLKLYADFIERYPEVRVYNELNVDAPITVRAWLRTRSGDILGSLGRYREATLLASQATGELRGDAATYADREGWGYLVALANAYRHNLQTAKVLVPKGLAGHHRDWDDNRNIVRFQPGSREVVYRRKQPLPSSYGQSTRDGKAYFRDAYIWHFLLAPDGYVFKKLTAYPLVTGTDAVMGGCLHKHYFGDSGVVHSMPITRAVNKGLVFDKIPRGGIFQMHFWIIPNDRARDPKYVFSGVRAVAEFEKVGPHGSIDVRCSNTNNFRVYIDGRRGRKGPGMIGLVPPGKHELEFRTGAMYSRRKITVNVAAARTTQTEVSLAWDPRGPWAHWSKGALIGKDYPPDVSSLRLCDDPPAIQADDNAVRVFWSRRGDLWWAVSKDGEKFSRPAKLPLPVSTGWVERTPQCLRDESGRFLLTFLSDREGQHQMRTYMCWSRGGVYWSRPAMVVDRSVEAYDYLQNKRGMFIWADTSEKKVTVMRSRDAYLWEKLAELPLDGRLDSVRIVQTDNGAYELFVAEMRYRTKHESWQTAETTVYHYRSKDLRKWSAKEVVTRLRPLGGTDLSVVTAGRQLALAVFRSQTSKEGSFLQVLRRDEGGRWQGSSPQHGLASADATMAYHPKWGYMITWKKPPDTQFPSRGLGPYLIRGKNLAPLFRKKAEKKK